MNNMSKSIKIETVRGMDDLLPHEMAVKRMIEDRIRSIFKMYGYEEIETPTVEHYDIFEVKSGEEIRERMFTFFDRAGRKLVLRPEMTAPVARLVVTKLSRQPLPIRLGYIADCYRYDEPQWGRKRRFYHGGFELFGSSSAAADAEILQVSKDVFDSLNLKDHFFKVGHVGILRSLMESAGMPEAEQDIVLSLIDRKRSGEALMVVPESEERSTIERLMGMEGDESILKVAHDLLTPWELARKALENLMDILELAKIANISRFNVNLGFARGLAYYTGFIFEQYIPGIDIAFNGGGRYDKLTQIFGGREIPAVGCAVGITRILQYLLEKVGHKAQNVQAPRALLIRLGEGSMAYAVKVATSIRSIGISLELDLMNRKFSDAVDYCLKKGIKFLIMVGDKEEKDRTIIVRDLEARYQKEIQLEDKNAILSMLQGTSR